MNFYYKINENEMKNIKYIKYLDFNTLLLL